MPSHRCKFKRGCVVVFVEIREIGGSVQAAIPGWTLLIHTGAYPEKITITKPLTLRAEGGPVTIGN